MAPDSPDQNEINSLVYGDPYNILNGPDASQSEGDDDESASTPEPDAREDEKESIYVTVLESVSLTIFSMPGD